MRRFLVLAWLGAAAALACWARPMANAAPPLLDEVHEAAFIAALMERGEYDLARDYIRQLLPSAAPRLKPVLEALVLRAEAETTLAEGDESGFLAKLSAAGPKFEALAKEPPEAPFSLEARAARAEAELRRGQQLAAKAAEQAVPAARERYAKEALLALGQAELAYLQGASQLESVRTSLGRAADRKLTQRALDAYAQCLYGRGLALLEQSRVAGLSDQLSGQKLQQAVLALDKLTNLKESTPWVSRGQALTGLCYQGVDSRRAEEAYQKALRDRRPEALAGQKDVRLFKLQGLLQAVQGGRKAERAKLIAEAPAWLADYAAWNRTPEALELRHQLALALMDEVAELPEAERSAAEARAKLDGAVRQWETLARAPWPKRNAAEQRLLSSQLLLNPKLGPAAALKSFPELEQRLRLDLVRLNRLDELLAGAKEGPDREKLTAERNALMADLRTETARGAELQPKNLAGKDADRWRQLLFDALVRLGKWPEAAAVGEALAFGSAQPDLARQAAEQTLKLYAALQRRGDSAAQAKLGQLALKVIELQPQSPAADLARELLGQQRYQEQKYGEAAKLFEQVSPTFPRHALCGFQAGLAWWGQHVQATRQGKQPLATESEAKGRAFQLMERHLPALEASPDPDAARVAVNNRFILADLQLRAGQVEKALATLGPLVRRVEKKELPADLPAGTAAQILSLALRAEALKDPSSPATLARLQALQKLGDQGELGGGVAERFQELGQQLRGQMLQLEKEGPAAAERLKATKERLRLFLAQVEKLPQLTPELRLWLAGQFFALDDPAKAAALFATMPKPGPNASPAQVQTYRASRLQYVDALRAAAAAEPEPAGRAQKLAAFEAALADAMQEDWAKKHPAFLKEKVMVEQLKGNLGGPGGAIEQWDKLRQALEPHVGKSAMYREIYQDTQYQLVWCLAAQANREADAIAKAKGFTRAGQLVVLLRRNDYGGGDQKARFEALLARPEMSELRAEVERLSQER